MLAGLQAEGVTSVTEPESSRDHTERMLQAFGCEVLTDGLKKSFVVNNRYMQQSINVPGDISSAAFFLVAGPIVPNSEITMKNVGMNPTRTGILDVLEQMGADIHNQQYK